MFEAARVKNGAGKTGLLDFVLIKKRSLTVRDLTVSGSLLVVSSLMQENSKYSDLFAFAFCLEMLSAH